LDNFAFINHTSRRLYAAMVSNLDTMIGSVVAELKSKGLYDNTLIVLSADNGGPVYNNGSAGANNWPLRGGKTSNWEGGVRTNAFASGGLIPEKVRGTKIEGLTAIQDWYGTFCALAGVDSYDTAGARAGLPPVESLNLWPLLSGANSTSPRTEILLGNDNGGTHVQGIISGHYKFLQGLQSQDGWQGPFYPNDTVWNGDTAIHDCTGGCLFDIFEDPTEHNDLATTNPTLLKSLKARLDEAQKTVFSPNRGKTDPTACTAALGPHKGYWGPFV